MFGRSSVKQLPTKADSVLARRRLKARSLTFAAVSFSAIALVCGTVAFILWSHATAIAPDNTNASKLQSETSSNFFQMWSSDCDPPSFSKTLKDCEGKCLEFIPEGTTRERIALVRPQGAIGDMFTKFVQTVVDSHSNNTTNFVLIPTSHVPPYGYGKTHGFTKILRLSVSPLLMHAADVLLRVADGSDGGVGVQDLKQTVRQLVRWHCRLSHVAAHTSLLTVRLEDMITKARDTTERIRLFMSLVPNADIDQFARDESLEMNELVAQLEITMKSLKAILVNANDEAQQPIEHAIGNVIQDELDMTNNLQKWPCLSFWSVGDDSNPETLTPLASHVALQFSPNCSAEFTECGVKTDRCEERGDAKCK